MADFFKWEYVVSFFPKILAAVPTTLLIVLVASVIGMLLGLAIAFARIEKVPLFSQLGRVFVSFIRGTPIIVQLFLVFYGLPVLVETLGGSLAGLSKLDYVFITYGLNTAAFFAEIFRSALLSVPVSQKEAAAAIGLTKLQSYRRVIVPQAVRIALPATGTMIVNLLQDTSLAFSLGVIDVIGKVRALAALTYHSLEGYFIAAIIFIVLSLVLERLFGWLERRYQFRAPKVVRTLKPAVQLQPLVETKKKLPKII